MHAVSGIALYFGATRHPNVFSDLGEKPSTRVDGMVLEGVGYVKVLTLVEPSRHFKITTCFATCYSNSPHPLEHLLLRLSLGQPRIRT